MCWSSRDSHRTIPMPPHDEIRLVCDQWRAIRRICDFEPDGGPHCDERAAWLVRVSCSRP